MKHHQHIAELGPLLHRMGISRVVISPGSRNAPLTQLFTSSEFFDCYSIVDERSAGYIALGMARQLGEVVAILSTSGTAVLNLAPAVAEAFYQQLPLLVITADRPLERIPSFNNQWLDQQAPFYAWSRGFLSLPPRISHPEDMEQMLLRVQRLLRASTDEQPGPVHLNVLLEEPLYEKLPEAGAPLPEALSAEDAGAEEGASETFDSEDFQIQDHERIMILAGMQGMDKELEGRLKKISASGRVLVVAENISNQRDDVFVAHPELTLAHCNDGERKEMLPDLVIAVGGQVVSKRLNLFLQENSGLKHLQLSSDELGRLDLQSPSEMDVDYRDRWKKAEDHALRLTGTKLAGLPFSSFSVVERSLALAPPGCIVHLGNSTAIRYSQLLPCRKDLLYYSNRGTSGIDGCVSAAVGAAMVSKEMHLLLAGDLSFVYDSNALWNREFPPNLKIVVLNDRGGGIFRLLEGPDKMDFFEKFSVTHHPVSLEKLAGAFGRKNMRVADLPSLERGIESLWEEEGGLSILVADTSGSENSRIFKQFFK